MPRQTKLTSTMLQLVLVLLLTLLTGGSSGFTSSEQGVKEAQLSMDNQYVTFAKSLYKGAEVLVHIVCPPAADPKAGNATRLRIGWMLRQSPCAEEYADVDARPNRAPMYYKQPEIMQIKDFDYAQTSLKRYPDMTAGDAFGGGQCLVCHPGAGAAATTLLLPNLDRRPPTSVQMKIPPSRGGGGAFVPLGGGGSGNASRNATSSRRSRRAAAKSKSALTPPSPSPSSPPPTQSGDSRPGLVTRTWTDGVYLFVLHAYPCCQDSVDPLDCPSSGGGGARMPSVTARIEIANSYGYLSAIDWPLLPFFGSMCLLYLLFGLLWLGLCARYWREMLRIQFCISGVIFLGMLEKALFYAEYQSINSSGVSVRGAILLAELVSCIKRSVARMLVLIVCLGYGIVKPRLGQLQHKVIAIGLVYFVFSAVESSLRATRPRFHRSNKAFYATIPLAVTDAIICWWIFSSLVQTIRNLRVRRNLVKLSLYRHFTNTLVFCVVCSVIFMAWTVGKHKFAVCITAWRELWIDDAFWHLLFSVILFVIIVLWRPSQNNQRYAFSPLLDAGNDSDEEDEEVVMDNLAEGVKVRGAAAAASAQQQHRRSRSSSRDRGGGGGGSGAGGGEDNLRWVEENIPQSLVESTLPSLLNDSDEEVLTTRYEMSKLL